MGRNRVDRTPATPLRLFVAADVPEDVKSSLAAAIGPHRDRIPPARWTRSDGWHITLKFLGSTLPRLLDLVRESVAAAAVEAPPFETALTHVGVFPSERRARVLWAGLADPDGRFPPLVSRLDGLLADHFVEEKRAFTPHLTLARLNPSVDVGNYAPGLVGTEVASRTFPVDRLVLYRSHLSPQGARYEAQASFPLGG
jgi:RNA 2',3'-cyclic 3'-phosphodiesterase